MVQDIEACLHCLRYSAEAVPLGEDKSLPILFGEPILGRLSQRPSQGRGEGRLRLTVVCLIREYFSLLPKQDEFSLSFVYRGL